MGGSKGFAMVELQYHTVAGSYTMVVSSYRVSRILGNGNGKQEWEREAGMEIV